MDETGSVSHDEIVRDPQSQGRDDGHQIAHKNQAIGKKGGLPRTFPMETKGSPSLPFHQLTKVRSLYRIFLVFRRG